MISVSLPFWGWLAAALMIFASGKFLQEGARRYERGDPWQIKTFIGVALQLMSLVYLALGYMIGGAA